MQTKTIGGRIRHLREISGMSQAELAGQLYVSDKTVSSWETGRTKPDIIMIVRISAVFHASLDELLIGSKKTL